MPLETPRQHRSPSVLTRAAANSIASAIPSRRRQTSAIAFAFASSMRKAASTARARCTKSAIAS